MLPNEGCAQERDSRFMRSSLRRGTALEKAGWNNSSIDPRSLRQLSKISVHNAQNFGLETEVLSSNRGAKVTPLASRRGATRWAREVSRHVVVLHGHAARTGGDVELFHRGSRYAPARLPLVAETLPVRGSVSARVFSRSRRPREVPAARIPQRTALPSRHDRVVCSCFCRLTQFLCFPPRQASRCPWWSPPSASPSGARKPCLHPTRTRSPRRSEEATDARAGWRRDGHGVDSSRIVVSTQRA